VAIAEFSARLRASSTVSCIDRLEDLPDDLIELVYERVRQKYEAWVKEGWKLLHSKRFKSTLEKIDEAAYEMDKRRHVVNDEGGMLDDWHPWRGSEFSDFGDNFARCEDEIDVDAKATFIDIYEHIWEIKDGLWWWP